MNFHDKDFMDECILDWAMELEKFNDKIFSEAEKKLLESGNPNPPNLPVFYKLCFDIWQRDQPVLPYFNHEPHQETDKEKLLANLNAAKEARHER